VFFFYVFVSLFKVARPNNWKDGVKRQHLVTLVISTPREEQTSTFFWHRANGTQQLMRENRKTSVWLGTAKLAGCFADVVGQ